MSDYSSESSIDEIKSSEDEPVLKINKRRRGVRNDDKYKLNVIKKARLKGREYMNHANKLVAEKKQGPSCR